MDSDVNGTTWKDGYDMELNELGKQVVADAKTYKRKPFTAPPTFIRLMNGEGAYKYEFTYTTEDLTAWESTDSIPLDDAINPVTGNANESSDRAWKTVKTSGEKIFTNKHTVKGFHDPKGEFSPNGYADLLKAISED